MVRRLYVEKKQGFDALAENLKKELEENLGVAGLEQVRVINRYDVENITDELYEKAKGLVFSERALDDVCDEEISIPENAFAFGIEYLPGQFDQRADSAMTCIRLIDPEAAPRVRCARFIVVSGLNGEALDEDDKAKIVKYCINPVDSRQASFEKPETLETTVEDPPMVGTVDGFRDLDEAGLRRLEAEMSFAMSHEDLRFVQSYFRDEQHRDPTITELRVIDTYWSDHCRHTTFLTKLTDVSFEEGGISGLVSEAYNDYLRLRREVYGDEAAAKRPVTLMDMATIGAKYLKRQGLVDDLDESEEINACSIKVKAEIIPGPGAEPVTEAGVEAGSATVVEDWLVMFKNETHNHPTEIEPFGGAATCLGGAIRDPLSGRSYVYQAMRVTGAADPRTSIEDTLPGKLTQYQITRGAAKGYSSYGNQIGIATGLVDEIYDNSYVAKRLEIGAVVGAVPAKNVVRETPASGDVILIVGGRTGRDGIGGATGSSKEHTEESIHTAGAEVQKGNPPIERDIQRLFRRPEAARLIKRCNDFGAGGVAVAVGELAPGIDVDLDKVLKKYEGLDGTELAVSESQERMAVVVSAENQEEFLAYAEEENLEAGQAAVVTDTGHFRMYWRGNLILDLSREFLDTNGVAQERAATIKSQWGTTEVHSRDVPFCVTRDTKRYVPTVHLFASEHRKNRPYCVAVSPALQSGTDSPNSPKETLLGLLSSLNTASKRGLIENFDSTIGAGTLLMPLGGKEQLTPAAGMAAKLPVLSGDTNTATLMSYGFDPTISGCSPFHGAMYAVLDSCAKLGAMGGDIKRARLSLQEYFPKLGADPVRWGLPVMALLGALKAQIALGVPAIGGKDSMSGSFEGLDVVPTLVSFAICAADARSVISPEFKRAGSLLVFLECPMDENGVPDFEAFKTNMERINALISEGKLLAANTISHGGVFTAVAKMAVGNVIGAELGIPDHELKGEPEPKGDGSCGSKSEARHRDNENRPLCLVRTGHSAEEYEASQCAQEAGSCDVSALENLTQKSYGSLLLEIDAALDPATLFAGLPWRVIGKTTESAELVLRPYRSGDEPIIIRLSEILERWEAPLAQTFPVEAEHKRDEHKRDVSYCVQTDESVGMEHKKDRPYCVPCAQTQTDESGGVEHKKDRPYCVPYCVPSRAARRTIIAKPRVFIPIFPGTNCEVDSRRAFERAGAEVTVLGLLTMDPEKLQESIRRMADEIRRSQIVMIPGGFSGGDEPEGSAKLITAVFRNPFMTEAVTELLEERDGLMLGVCNGFQALIKLGLVTYGRITEPDASAPTLTYNKIGRHMSRIVRVRVCSTLSPWLAAAEIGDVHSLPVSHGEGRFIANEDMLAVMEDAGQIATQYVDLSGTPSGDIRYNPNGSTLAIEGVTSPDGRVFGRMGHPERNVPGLYVNVPGNFDTSLFASGVAYFG